MPTLKVLREPMRITTSIGERVDECHFSLREPMRDNNTHSKQSHLRPPTVLREPMRITTMTL